MGTTSVVAAFLLGTMILLSLAPQETEAAIPIVTCKNCSVYVWRCGAYQKCCNKGSFNGACAGPDDTCPEELPCGTTTCGVDCNNAPVYCPPDKVCCNACTGANLCVTPGTTCSQDCDGCPTK
jgi:hypothetical protein